MQIKIPLSHFVAYLNEVTQKRRTWLDETRWLMAISDLIMRAPLMIHSQSERHVTTGPECSGWQKLLHFTLSGELFGGVRNWIDDETRK